MPVLSPHRSSSSGGYRSSFGSSLERPYYTPSSYPRISSYSERFTSRSYTDADGRRVYTRSGSITEDGVTTRYREEQREGSAPRRESLCRRDSALSEGAALELRAGRDPSLGRGGGSERRPSAASVLDSVAELRSKYSPANYVPACLRKANATAAAAATTDAVSRSRSIGDIGLPPLAAAAAAADSARSSALRKKVNNTDGLNCNNSTGVTANHTNSAAYEDEEDDNGNRASVADLRRRFDDRTGPRQPRKSPSPPIDTPKVADNIFKRQDVDAAVGGRRGVGGGNKPEGKMRSDKTALKTTEGKMLNGEGKTKRTAARAEGRPPAKTDGGGGGGKLEAARNGLKKGQEVGSKTSSSEPSIDKLHSGSSSSLSERYADAPKMTNGRDKTIKDLEKTFNDKDRAEYDKESVLNDIRRLQVSSERLRERFTGDRDKLNGERERASSERDKISSEKDGVSGERIKIHEKARTTNERERTIGEKSKATNDSDKMTVQRDRIGGERTKAVGDSDKMVVDRERKPGRDGRPAGDGDKATAVRDKLAVDKDKPRTKLVVDRERAGGKSTTTTTEEKEEGRRLAVNGERLAVNGCARIPEGDAARAHGDAEEVDAKRRLDKAEDSDGEAVAHKISRVNDYASFYPVKGCPRGAEQEGAGEEATGGVANGGLSCVGGAADVEGRMEVNGVLDPEVGASPKLTRSTVSPSGSGVSGAGLAVVGGGAPAARRSLEREQRERRNSYGKEEPSPPPPPLSSSSSLYDKLDRERSLTNNHQDRIYDKLYDRASPVKTLGLNGLKNIGNTCFMNSVIQCLSNTRLLNEYLRKDAYARDINTTISGMKGALIRAFAEVIKELWGEESSDRVVNTVSLKSQIQRFAPRFMGYAQQDAQEFLRYLLEGLHEDVNRVTEKPKPILTEIDEKLSDGEKSKESWQRYLRMDNSRIVDIFVGQLKSTLRCTHCGHASVTFDPFWDLSLPIPQRTGQLRLSQCLDSFTREETLDGDEKPTCSKCKERRKCTKSFTIQKFPKILVIHLKRFSPTERFRGKLNVTVDFPLEGLDMGNYGAEGAGPARYSLYAVSNHSGTTYSGHYTAYCRHPYAHTWHEYNDSRVSSQSSKSVVSSEAYVLFYELDGQKSHL